MSKAACVRLQSWLVQITDLDQSLLMHQDGLLQAITDSNAIFVVTVEQVLPRPTDLLICAQSPELMERAVI